MNKHLVENFLAFRNSQGRSRDANDDQEDSPGDEVLAADQGVRGRMRNHELISLHFLWRKVAARFSICSRTGAFANTNLCGSYCKAPMVTPIETERGIDPSRFSGSHEIWTNSPSRRVRRGARSNSPFWRVGLVQLTKMASRTGPTLPKWRVGLVLLAKMASMIACVIILAKMASTTVPTP
ncbi:hypothetical protein F2Q68_00034647 [Brassica cretica]|uniref:Uncharacterized protein n=1 Tax=Brassica cretica TaxID=69181 RepID=A0A8S9H531_BRACR|nr:hypothetical protein F2Q68_00034647 [Brassica cretica]